MIICGIHRAKTMALNWDLGELDSVLNPTVGLVLATQTRSSLS